MRKLFYALIVLLLSGCTHHWATLDLKPDFSDTITPYTTNKKTNECVAILNDLRVKSNGQEINASSDFHKRFILNIKDANVFTSVAQDMPLQKMNKYVTFALSVNENQDTNQGSNVVKGFFIGLTLYLLAPALPLSYDFESEMFLNATKSDGKTKQYSAKGKGTAYFHLFANAPLAGQEVRAMVTNNNINALMNQLVADRELLCGL